MPKRVHLIAACAANGVIGRNGRLPWHLPEDYERFEAMTAGQTCIMGRVSFLGWSRATADGRRPIVITRDTTLVLSGAVSDANGITSVQVYDGEVLLGSADVSGGAWTFTTAALGEGAHGFTAAATDKAGLVASTAAVTANVETTAPAVSFSTTLGTDSGLTSTISSGDTTRDNTLALSGTVSDASGVSQVEVFDGGSSLGLAALDTTQGTWT